MRPSPPLGSLIFPSLALGQLAPTSPFAQQLSCLDREKAASRAFSPDAQSSEPAVVRATARSLHDRVVAEPRSTLAKAQHLSQHPVPKGVGVLSAAQEGPALGVLTSRPMLGGPGIHSLSAPTLSFHLCGCGQVFIFPSLNFLIRRQRERNSHLHVGMKY